MKILIVNPGSTSLKFKLFDFSGPNPSVPATLAQGKIERIGSPASPWQFVLGEGESVEGPIPPTGNTNTRGFFNPDVRTFLKSWVAQGPTHHFALGVGHRANLIHQIAEILDVDSVIVSPQ